MEPGWYRDPEERFPFRWFDGSGWTDGVADSLRSWHDPGGNSLKPPPPPIAATPLQGQAVGRPRQAEAAGEGSIWTKPLSKSDRSATLIAIILVVVLAVFVVSMGVDPMNERAEVMQRTERLLPRGP